MKTVLKCGIVLFAFLCVLGSDARSQGRFGFGIVFGEPTGIAWKYKIDHINALDGAVGLSPFDRFRAHVDYLWQSYPFDEQHLALHYGLGGAFGFGRQDVVVVNDRGDFFRSEEDLGFGVRAVIGLTYSIPRSPVDAFLEFAPIFVVTPGTGMGFDVGLGARVYP